METKTKPSLSEITLEELEKISEVQRKSPSIIKVKRHTKEGLKKALAVTLVALGAMYYGAKFNQEISQIEEKITNYLSNEISSTKYD